MKLLHLGVLLAAVWVIAGCSALAPHSTPVASGRIYCMPLDYRDMRVDVPALRAPGSLRVPVALHLMDRHDDLQQTVLRMWAPQYVDDREAPMDTVLRKINAYFGADQFGVNAIWRQAGIHFDVQIVEWCRYKRSAAGMTSTGWPLPPDPGLMREEHLSKQRERVDAYLEWNQFYGFSRMLNVYLWANIEGANGYGESPRRGRIEIDERGIEALPTVWIESELRSCRVKAFASACQARVAHELGHALGLGHVCRVCEAGRCCDELCWSGVDHYYSYCRPPASCAEQAAAPAAIVEQPCCCGCKRVDDVVDMVNLCGESMVCCQAEYPVAGRLMFEPATGLGKSGTELCAGEIHSARAAVREFFPHYQGGGEWQRK
jgi:hypothetical protein